MKKLVKFFILICAGILGVYLAQYIGINEPIFSLFNTKEGLLLNDYMRLHMLLIQGLFATVMMIVINIFIKVPTLYLLLCALSLSVIMFVMVVIENYSFLDLVTGSWYMKNYYLAYMIGLLAGFGLYHIIQIIIHGKIGLTSK